MAQGKGSSGKKLRRSPSDPSGYLFAAISPKRPQTPPPPESKRDSKKFQEEEDDRTEVTTKGEQKVVVQLVSLEASSSLPPRDNPLLPDKFFANRIHSKQSTLPPLFLKNRHKSLPGTPKTSPSPEDKENSPTSPALLQEIVVGGNLEFLPPAALVLSETSPPESLEDKNLSLLDHSAVGTPVFSLGSPLPVIHAHKNFSHSSRAKISYWRSPDATGAGDAVPRAVFQNLLVFKERMFGSMTISNTQTLELYGHRGARGLSPENTLPAYRTAISVGVDYVDMDVGMTRDGVVVVTHDIALNPDITRDAKGQWLTDNSILVKDLTLAELQNYDVGRIKPGTQYSKLFPYQYPIDHTPIPTLKQVIQYVKQLAGDKVAFQIEIKTDPEYPDHTASPKIFVDAIAKILQEENIITHTVIQAFDYRCLLELQKINSEIITAYLTDKDGEIKMYSKDPNIAGLWTAGHLLKDYDSSILNMIAKLGGKIWGPQDTQLTPELVQAAHQHGLKVVPWSWPEKIGKELDIEFTEKLITMGIDGIITDRPDILRGLMAARGMRVPSIKLNK